MSDKVIYTAHFVQNRDELLSKLPPAISGKGVKVHAHHVTKEFRPADGKQGIVVGRQRILKITGFVVAGGVHAAIVESPEGDEITVNKHSHTVSHSSYNKHLVYSRT